MADMGRCGSASRALGVQGQGQREEFGGLCSGRARRCCGASMRTCDPYGCACLGCSSDCLLTSHAQTFRSQFQVANPTEAYSAVVSLLPDTFVGDAQQLHDLTKAVCAEVRWCAGWHQAPAGAQRSQRAGAADCKWRVAACSPRFM